MQHSLKEEHYPSGRFEAEEFRGFQDFCLFALRNDDPQLYNRQLFILFLTFITLTTTS